VTKHDTATHCLNAPASEVFVSKLHSKTVLK